MWRFYYGKGCSLKFLCPEVPSHLYWRFSKDKIPNIYVLLLCILKGRSVICYHTKILLGLSGTLLHKTVSYKTLRRSYCHVILMYFPFCSWILARELRWIKGCHFIYFHWCKRSFNQSVTTQYYLFGRLPSYVIDGVLKKNNGSQVTQFCLLHPPTLLAFTSLKYQTKGFSNC